MNAYVGVHPIGEGRAWVFVVIDDKNKWDAIPIPAIDHRQQVSGSNVLTKTVEAEGVTVIFQHWLETEPQL